MNEAAPNENADPPRWRRVALRVALPLILLAIGIFGMSALVAMRKPNQRVEPQRIAPLVMVEPIAADAGTVRLHVDGTVVPKREVTIAAEVAGRIVAVNENFKAGRYVTQGTQLVFIDKAVYELAVGQLKAEQAQLAADQEQLAVEGENLAKLIQLSTREEKLALENLRRAQELYNPERGIRNITPAQFEAVELELLRAQNSLQQLKNSQSLLASRGQRLIAQQLLAEYRLRQAEIDLERTTIFAPLSGVISMQAVEVNDFVQRGTVLFKIEDTQSVEVRCQLRADDLYWIWSTTKHSAGGTVDVLHEPPRVKAKIYYDVAGQRYAWDGFLARYEGSGLSSTTRTVATLVEVPQPQRLGATDGPPTLIRGMYVQIEMEIEPLVPLLRLPIEALHPPNIIWTVDPVADTPRAADTQLTATAGAGSSTASQPQTGKLRVHEVRVAKLLPDSVLIRAEGSTVRTGDLVVISPLAVGIDEMAVRYQPARNANHRGSGTEIPPTH